MRFGKIIIAILLQIFLYQFGICAKSNYYIEVGKSNIEIGEYLTDSYKKKAVIEFKIGEENLDEISKFLLTDSTENILFYFHAMWGGMNIFHKNSLEKLNEISGLDKIVSIIWHADNISYKHSYEESINQGVAISEIIDCVTSYNEKNIFILCHSMGHRFFVGAVKDLKPPQTRFRAVFFAAADLDTNVFSQNLSYLPAISNKIIVYVHEKDRLLKLSKSVQKKDRLGLNSIEYLSEFREIENLEFVNVTESTRGKTSSLTNHSYFKKLDGVLRDIEFVINNNEEERQNSFKVLNDNYSELK